MCSAFAYCCPDCAPNISIYIYAYLRAYHGQVTEYLHAGARQFGFMLRGLRELEPRLEALNIPFFLVKVGAHLHKGLSVCIGVEQAPPGSRLHCQLPLLRRRLAVAIARSHRGLAPWTATSTDPPPISCACYRATRWPPSPSW